MRIKKKYSYYFIYLTKNTISNKCYIGWHATNNLNDGYVGSGRLLGRSINKYGEDKFITGIIEFCSKENVLSKEKYWIKKLNSMVPNGYNLTGGGDGGNTYELLSEDDKKKFREQCSKQNKGRKFSKEHKKKISESHIGHSWNKDIPKSEECKEKMADAWKIRRLTPVSNETKEKISRSQLGHQYHTNDSKEKISIANSKRIWNEESKLKISQKNKGLKRSEKTKELMRKKFACIYCGEEMNKSNLSRYHNENCKFK